MMHAGRWDTSIEMSYGIVLHLDDNASLTNAIIYLYMICAIPYFTKLSACLQAGLIRQALTSTGRLTRLYRRHPPVFERFLPASESRTLDRKLYIDPVDSMGNLPHLTA